MSDANYYERYYQGKLTKANAFDTAPEMTEKSGNWKESEKFCRFLEKQGIKIKAEDKILDLGCGPGHTLGYLQSKGVKHLCGCDISKTAIEAAGNNYKKIDFKVIMPQEKLPYADNSFEGVWCSEVLEHVIDTEEMVKEIKRVLKPGGWVLVTTTEMYLVKLILVGLLRMESYFHPMSPHIRHFTRRTLRELLESCGLTYKAYAMNGAYFGVLSWGQMAIARK